tara:strand:+ start:849 stop:1094 length:246 start_codon:yes stop_codon:yes gene_type:complete
MFNFDKIIDYVSFIIIFTIIIIFYRIIRGPIDNNYLDNYDKTSWFSYVPKGGSRDFFGNIYDENGEYCFFNSISDTNPFWD